MKSFSHFKIFVVVVAACVVIAVANKPARVLFNFFVFRFNGSSCFFLMCSLQYPQHSKITCGLCRKSLKVFRILRLFYDGVVLRAVCFYSFQSAVPGSNPGSDSSCLDPLKYRPLLVYSSHDRVLLINF